jgi:hypothetical protein
MREIHFRILSNQKERERREKDGIDGVLRIWVKRND